MAFLSAGLHAGVLADPEEFVLALKNTSVKIGPPEEACVTGTIQKIRQEPKKPSSEQPYIANIAFREVAFLRGILLVAFDSASCPTETTTIAPLVNYFGKRGSFFQFEGAEDRAHLDVTFTMPTAEGGVIPSPCHLATLDDFGPEATFDALNSFSDAPIKRWKHRTWIESAVPLGVHNVGPGFVHYKR